MEMLRIKKKSGAFIDLESMDELDAEHMLITINEWDSSTLKTAKIHLNLFQIRELSIFLDTYMQTKIEKLQLLEKNRIRKKRSLQRIYEEAEISERFTHEQLLKLKEMGISITHLLAKDLAVSVQELYEIIQTNHLPFALLKKHFEYCEEQITHYDL